VGYFGHRSRIMYLLRIMVNVQSVVLAFFWCMTFGLQGMSLVVGSEFKTLEISHRPSPQGRTELNLLKSNAGLSAFRADQPALFNSFSITIPLTEGADFQTFTPIVSIANFTGSNFELQVRGSSDGVEWNPWISVEPAVQAPFKDSMFFGEMLVWDANIHFFEYQLIFPATQAGTLPASVQQVRLDFFSPGAITPLAPEDVVRVSLQGADPDCPCALPTFADRSQWDCPDGRAASCASPSFAPTSHLIIHQLDLPGAIDNYRAFVRSVWQVQTGTYGQCDLTYNWLIDPNGVIYEGRGGGDDVQGAHLCIHNTGTMGVALIGDFNQNQPAAAAIQALGRLLTWKSCESGLDPADMASLHEVSSRVVPVISLAAPLCDAQRTGPEVSNAIPFVRTLTSAKLDTCLLGVSLDPEKGMGVKVGPNPVSSRLFLSGEMLGQASYSYDLINLQGKIEQTGMLSPQPQQEISVDKLISGMYWLQIRTLNGPIQFQRPILILP
ncbi:MAG: N-acetylmuramoyl-L-alanine amidase, partial [Bacteroidota bacterium]